MNSDKINLKWRKLKVIIILCSQWLNALSYCLSVGLFYLTIKTEILWYLGLVTQNIFLVYTKILDNTYKILVDYLNYLTYAIVVLLKVKYTNRCFNCVFLLC